MDKLSTQDRLRLCPLTRADPLLSPSSISQVFDGTLSNDRIGPLLLPRRLAIEGRDLTSAHLTLLQTRSSTLPPIPLVSLELRISTFDANTTSHFLRHLNPYRLAIGIGHDRPVPTLSFVSRANLQSCTSSWTLLRKVACAGIASVPILTESGRFAFSEILSRCSPPSPSISDFDSERIRLVTSLS